jgi:type I restriction enzyme M protein
MSRIRQQQLESYLWGAAVLLRGTIDAGDYKQFIFPLLFYKRLCDVFDEEVVNALRVSGGDQDFALFPENHRFQIPADAHWREIRKVSRDVGRDLQLAMREIETANPAKLFGIFGDAQWTNKDRLSDAMLRDLIEHFSVLELTVANLPEDELGQGYEFLIKKFADDSGHTAAEFYTNRTVVHLMTEMLDVQPGESVYDPTCGSGGMLLSCIAHLRNAGKEWRNVKLYGQERNLMTSSIARMNCFLHGIEDFRIERGDTLAEPKLVEGDRLQRFDVALANPPYSIKQWDREAFATDPWGRNIFGVPPQGRADYAFWQHILQSLKPRTGRCAILFPHGVLFRQEEAEMRRKLIEADFIECVIGLGPNLFYNSPMEACVVVCRTQKARDRRGRILFINAVNEVTRERAQSFLTEEHLQRVVRAYQLGQDEAGFCRLVPPEEIRAKDGNLSILLYVSAETPDPPAGGRATTGVAAALASWIDSTTTVRGAVAGLLESASRPAKLAESVALQPNSDSSTLPLFDRAGWRRMAFGEFAESIGERAEPRDAQGEVYVGLEHVDPQCLHIRRWGKGSDVTGTKLRFRKGDIIFGRRRAYQRKLAVAEFDGICSAHAMVVRAKPDKVLPEFLPFLMMSDRFMSRAVDISVGSLSPTINWTTLKLETFDLPPLEGQRRIAEVLGSAATLQRGRSALSEALGAARQAKLASLFKGEHLRGSRNEIRSWGVGRIPGIRDLPVGWRVERLTSVARLESGHTPRRSIEDYWRDGDIPWISLHDTNELNQRYIGSTEQMTTPAGIKNSSARLLPAGTVVFCRTASIGLCSIMEKEMSTSQDFANFVCGPEVQNQYLYHLLRWMTPVWEGLMGGSTHKTIYMPDFQKLEVILPPIEQQLSISHQANALDDAFVSLQAQERADLQLLMTLVNGCLQVRNRSA